MASVLGQGVHVLLRPVGQVLGEVCDVLVGVMAGGDGMQVTGERPLAAVQFGQGRGDLAHGEPSVPAGTGAEAVFVGAGAGPRPPPMRRSAAAAVLKIGCLETGSQSVRVSSLAAR